MSDVEPDEGGEAPCYAHLIDEPLDHEALVMGLSDAVIVADAAGRITVWNEAATRLFGFEGAEAVGQSLDLIIPQRLQRRHWDGYREVMRSGHTRYGGQMLQVPAVHKDGHTFSVAFTVTLLIRPGEQQPHAIAAVLRDDSERYELSQAARGHPGQAAGWRERTLTAGRTARRPRDVPSSANPDLCSRVSLVSFASIR